MTMRKIIFFVYLVTIVPLFISCKSENTIEEQQKERNEIYIRKYNVNNIDILEQFSDILEFRIDTIEYILRDPLGEYRYSYGKIFTDSILHLWNQSSMKNIKERDPELKIDGNFVKYQILEIGDNYRTEFWRTINNFYFSWYNFEKGFYVVETENPLSDPNYVAYYLIVPKEKNIYRSYQFRFGIWGKTGLMSYLKDIKEIDYDIFFSYFIELEKQDIHDFLILGPSELTISYFHNDTIKSFVNIEYGNSEFILRMKELLDGTNKFPQ